MCHCSAGKKDWVICSTVEMTSAVLWMGKITFTRLQLLNQVRGEMEASSARATSCRQTKKRKKKKQAIILRSTICLVCPPPTLISGVLFGFSQILKDLSKQGNCAETCFASSKFPITHHMRRNVHANQYVAKLRPKVSSEMSFPPGTHDHYCCSKQVFIKAILKAAWQGITLFTRKQREPFQHGL